MIINNNISALNTHRQMGINQQQNANSMEKLSSGLRINRAGDDAAGLAISEKMRAQINGLDQASRNAQDGISMIQTAEGALDETHSILQRMRELAVQSANDTNTNEDRAEIQKEIDQLSTEIKRISTDTEFNTKKLLNGDMGKTVQKTAGDAEFGNLKATGIDLDSGSYALTVTDAGTNTITGTSGTTAFTATDLTAEMDVATGADISYGSYTLNVTNNDGSTADIELIGPGGKTTTVTGHALDSDLEIGGIDIGFSTIEIEENQTGTLKFDLTANGLDIDLTGDKTSGTGAITAYDGGTLNVGGFEFEVTTGTATSNGNAANLTVINNAVKFHIGANEDQNTQLAINDMSATALGVNDLNVTNQDGANEAITTINNAIETVSSERSKLGAIQNRLEHTISNLDNSSENLSAAESRIRDVDMAAEMMEMTRSNILSQASQSMLAQANQQPQSVLQLLG
ncbi:flagellin [Bacillus sp. H-16]|uniref:flagellin N-terminal helical domain-containing protein n=1 Tax=Alteribacter salitolerans TaxID=2912333 RepID=UPI0019631CA0|nr:flagellin [Alteribacter salitolerans]MBM7096853.1 flagellin [Alteribacter salitolerans]